MLHGFVQQNELKRFIRSELCCFGIVKRSAAQEKSCLKQIFPGGKRYPKAAQRVILRGPRGERIRRGARYIQSETKSVISNAGPLTSMAPRRYSPVQDFSCTHISAAKRIWFSFFGVI
jgi:hypothetical protein